MKDIVIVGGGTAGWMAALILSSRFPEKEITVIDPTSIAGIGVGESVTGVVLNLVNDPLYGLNIGDFFRRADATLKVGIWFKDWQGVGTDYLGPIDNPKSYFEHPYPEALEEFYAFAASDGVKLGKSQIHAHLMRANKTDYLRKGGKISGQFAHASCHLDALKFASWLQEICSQRPNISHLDEIVTSFDQEAETGLVTRVLTKSGRSVTGDFFLDCSGFRRLLLEPAYKPAWIDFSDHIKVDSAIPSPVSFAEGQEIPAYTTSRAMPNGWMWEVPTQSRLGKGYIYSSRYVSDEKAVEEMRAAGVDPGDDPRIIRFRPGKFATQWEGNVCAIGLAGGFIEALEATTIHGMNAQIKLLAELFLPFYTREAAPAMSAKYNAMNQVMYEDYVDFVSFHYHAGRNDTEFWRDYQKPASVTAANQARMEMWQHSFPHREDFSPIYTTRALLTSSYPVWMPMLCAMDYLKQDHGQKLMGASAHTQWARANVSRYLQLRSVIEKHAISQKDAIQFLRSGA